MTKQTHIKRRTGRMDVSDVDGKATGCAVFEWSSVDNACHCVVVSVGFPCGSPRRYNGRGDEPDYSPIACIGLGSRNANGVTFSKDANVSSLPSTVGKDGRSHGFRLQHSCAIFQSPTIPKGMPFGIRGRVPPKIALGTFHLGSISIRGILPERTYTKSMRPEEVFVPHTASRSLTS